MFETLSAGEWVKHIRSNFIQQGFWTPTFCPCESYSLQEQRLIDTSLQNRLNGFTHNTELRQRWWGKIPEKEAFELGLENSINT